MYWSEGAFFLSCLTVIGSNEFNFERAAQLALLGIAIDTSSEHKFLYQIFRIPFIFFLLFAACFELLHLLHKRKSKSMENTWFHIERLRGIEDLSTLINILLTNKDIILTGKSIYNQSI